MRVGALALLGLACTALAHGQELISHGRFKDVALYRGAGDVKQVVLFLSGDGGWSGGVVGMAHALVERGALVVGIDVPQLLDALRADGGSCVSPDGDLENLSRYVQGYEKLPSYYAPILVGYSSGATLAYAMLAQSPEGTFAAALSLGFCPDLALTKPLCAGDGLRFTSNDKGVTFLPDTRLNAPWAVLQGQQDQVCSAQATLQFANSVPGASVASLPKVGHGFSVSTNWLPQYLAAYDRLASRVPRSGAAPPAALTDLPLVEVPNVASGASMFAVMLSGDGGWAGLDVGVASALAERGVPVVGIDSLRYFWTARTPDGLAGDLDRVLRYYAARWHKSQAILIGYSQGADVLPFAINRLPATSASLVAQSVLLGPGEKATFQFHLANWLPGHDGGNVPIQPEAEKLRAATTLCLYGADESDSLCPKIAVGHVTAQTLPGGHHFDGAYGEIAALILQTIGKQ